MKKPMPQAQIESVGRDEWIMLAARFCDRNYRQGWAYGELLAQKRKASSNHIKFLGGRGGEIIGLADVRFKRAPLLGGIAYISGGPLTRLNSTQDLEHLGACLDALRRQFVEKEGLILRVQGSMGDPEWNRASAACFAAHGFSPASQGTPYRTVVVDLQPPLADIRSKLAQKWRNCLNKAQRTNPIPETSSRVEDFDRFTKLFDQFVGRKGFSVDLGADFFREVQRQAAPAEALTLTTIQVDGKLVAGHMASFQGDTCVYLLGATTDEALKTNAAYLLQWNVIEQAKARGLRWYDLGGIDPAENPGVCHFKCGMSGTEMTAPGPFECAPRTLRARLTLRAESAYRRWRRRAITQDPSGRAPETAISSSPSSPIQSRPLSSAIPPK